MKGQNNQEPPDQHSYSWISLYEDTFKFFRRALHFYVTLLESEDSSVQEDEDLSWLLSQREPRKSQLKRELDRARRVEAWAESKIAEGGEDAIDYDFHSISHELIRFLKTAGVLYLQHLKKKRNALSVKPNISKYVLESVDSQISALEEKINIGVFANATTFPTLVQELVDFPEAAKCEPEDLELITRAKRPRPVIIDSIQVLDTELRERCLDLFTSFHEDGKTERLDTVIAEATRILETRLRALARTDQTCVGVDLAKAAFAGSHPVLRVSDVAAEQEAAHLLYRGVFGFIRNQVQHRLLGKLNPERVLQILGMVDYLLHVAENAGAGTSTGGVGGAAQQSH